VYAVEITKKGFLLLCRKMAAFPTS